MFAFKDSNGRAPTYLAGLLHLRTPQRCMLLCFTGKNFSFDFINKVGCVQTAKTAHIWIRVHLYTCDCTLLQTVYAQ